MSLSRPRSPSMAQQDNLSTWLRASAENKINAKNAWKAPLIEHFTDIRHFRSGEGIDFLKASSTLEGCVKVYSTRVDDVSESTQRLLNSFGRQTEEESKKRSSKKKSDHIEKKLSNINLRERDESHFYDPVFSSVLSRTRSRFLTSILAQTESGTLLYGREEPGIVYDDEKVDIECEALPICAGLKEFRNAELPVHPQTGELNSNEQQHAGYAIEDGYEAVAMDDAYMDDFPDVQPDMDMLSGCTEHLAEHGHGGRHGDSGPETTARVEVLQNGTEYIQEESPFGYFRGWAGPSHWKIESTAPKRRAQSQPRERFLLDFTAEQDYSLLFERADTTMTKEQILERRKKKNLLPDDFSLGRRDLYRFAVRDGYFGMLSEQRATTAIAADTKSELLADAGAFPSDLGGLDGQDLSLRLENSLLIEDGFDESIGQDNAFGEHDDNEQGIVHSEGMAALKPPKAAKQINIKKLKEDVNRAMKTGQTVFSEIFRSVKENSEDREAKNISVHFCLISMLHLANENHLELQQLGNDIVVRRQPPTVS